jgi:hypothetical protein
MIYFRRDIEYNICMTLGETNKNKGPWKNKKKCQQKRYKTYSGRKRTFGEKISAPTSRGEKKFSDRKVWK